MLHKTTLMAITKKEFIEIIEAIRDQSDFDKGKARRLGDLLSADIDPHDNSRLTNLLFKNLHVYFPPVDGVCSIQEFCYDFDFGRMFLNRDPISNLWSSLPNYYVSSCTKINYTLSNNT